MKILKLSEKILFITTLISVVFLLQNCKKNTGVSPGSSTKPTMVASINDSAWIATGISARIDYNVITLTKTFHIYGVSGNKAIDLMTSQNNAGNTPGFQVNNNNDYPVFDYLIQPGPDTAFYAERSTVGTASGGSLLITAVDSVNRTISGTFSFPAFKNIYDSNGYVISEKEFAKISSGKFNSVPYTFYLFNPNL
jgi:hypothetical protein